MKKKIWFMEGLSSQRDIILGVKSFAEKENQDIEIFSSHRNERKEILSVSDFSMIEPNNEEERLSFIHSITDAHGINAIHTGRNCKWFESHRENIQRSGVHLTTGSTGTHWFELADEKVTFSEFMEKNGLPVVPSVRVKNVDELRTLLSHPPFPSDCLCIKPVTGIYGMGFWRFDDNVSPVAFLNNPESRVIHPSQYLAAHARMDCFTPQVLMPYLPGPEYSVDMVVSQGTVLAAIGRRKEGVLQYLENEGEAIELAINCARLMNADGMVNVQTRHNAEGKPLLLEINMRPSGGIGYTQHSGVNLPGLYAFHTLGLMDDDQVRQSAKTDFSPAVVRSVTDVILYPASLTNRID
ncbi:TPA: ATP-grasp domain-containing protein [Klebsiella pneumoniae subsp. pneumoniae]|nr:ATP-grasp domain-containing protein [Klebsiella pneumoniae subsp. pneumoniae]HDT4014047.1 ATP-grasp domain-containing protein [Klebsiella pneumoniae subsp. pneumoniae]